MNIDIWTPSKVLETNFDTLIREYSFSVQVVACCNSFGLTIKVVFEVGLPVRLNLAALLAIKLAAFLY
jgi:hypothetical protein